MEAEVQEHDVEQTAESREQRIAGTFAALSDTLADDFDIIDFLGALTRRCVDLLPVAAAGVLLGDHGGQLHPLAASDEIARLLELLEMQNDEGPCLDCFGSGTPVINGDLDAAGTAWPAFAAHARASGYQITHALPLQFGDTVVGALNLFGCTLEPLGRADVDLGRSLAEAAVGGISHQRAVARGGEAALQLQLQLQRALTSRILIEQAKGVLAERMQVHVDDAFAVLRDHARRHHQPLSELARAVAEGGDLEGPNDKIRHW